MKSRLLEGWVYSKIFFEVREFHLGTRFSRQKLENFDVEINETFLIKLSSETSMKDFQSPALQRDVQLSKTKHF
jgi:hypothetical protein